MLEPIPFDVWNSDPDTFAQRLGVSFRETGFAVISGHPIKAGLVDEVMALTAEFFALPEQEKRNFQVPGGNGQRGYTPFGTESAKGETRADQKEFWHTGRKVPGGKNSSGFMPPTPEVPDIKRFDAATYALYEAMDDFGRELLRASALDLGLPLGWFDSRIDMGDSILRLLHYPPQVKPPKDGAVRAAAHEDINLLTLLFGAEQAGLQVKLKSGEWLDVNPPPDSIVINCGDMLQRLTGGILPSTTHRVLNPSADQADKPRYSCPFFLHFNNDVMIEALPECLAMGGKAQPPITAGNYLRERLIEIGLMSA